MKWRSWVGRRPSPIALVSLSSRCSQSGFSTRWHGPPHRGGRGSVDSDLDRPLKLLMQDGAEPFGLLWASFWVSRVTCLKSRSHEWFAVTHFVLVRLLIHSVPPLPGFLRSVFFKMSACVVDDGPRLCGRQQRRGGGGAHASSPSSSPSRALRIWSPASLESPPGLLISRNSFPNTGIFTNKYSIAR